MGYVNIGFIEYCQAGEKTIRHTRKFITDLHHILHKMNALSRPTDSTYFNLNQKGFELIEKWLSDINLATECLDIKELKLEDSVTLNKSNKNYDPDIRCLVDPDQSKDKFE